MSYTFLRRGPIVVRVRAENGVSEAFGQFALDTGAERTCIPPELAETLGLHPLETGTIWTASQLVRVQVATVPRFDALGITRRDLSVLVHPLPRGLPMVGLVGLDFLRDTRLTIDFRAGVVAVR